MSNQRRTATRVLGLAAALLIAAGCTASTTGGSPAASAIAPTAVPASVAPASVAPASVAPPSATPSEATPSEATASEDAGEVYELTIVKDAKLGDFLAGEDDLTLYTFTPDTAPNKSTCNGECAGNWPPFIIEDGESVVAGDGVTGKIATFARDDGKMQVSYNGKPVYFFKNDKTHGDANGQGLAEKWFVVKP